MFSPEACFISVSCIHVVPQLFLGTELFCNTLSEMASPGREDIIEEAKLPFG